MSKGPVRTQEMPAPDVDTQFKEVDKPTPVFTDALGVTHYARPAAPIVAPPKRVGVTPEDKSAEVQRIAMRLAAEQHAADRERARRRAARKGKDGRWAQDGEEVKPFAAFRDAVNLDGSQMLDVDGTSLAKPGYQERWVRIDEGPNDKDDFAHVNQREAEGWEIITKKDGTPLRGRLGQAMQATIQVAAEYTMRHTPHGVMDREAMMESLEETAAAQNAGLGYKQVKPWQDSRVDRHQEEHLLTIQQ